MCWAGSLLLIALGVGLVGCAPERPAPVDTRIAAASSPEVTGSGNLDILFMIDDSSGMTVMQDKLADQIPSMMNAIGSLPTGFPSTHIAVISSDLGAPGDSVAKIGCTPNGDYGAFQTQPRGACKDSTLTAGATFVSDAHGVVNYTAANIADVVQCILPLGESGCRFTHPLAAIAHALGVDGTPQPDRNAEFLRPDALLAVIILTHQDDCSAASPVTPLYSLNGGPNNLTNSGGPLATYRCNEFGHLCRDPRGKDPSALNPPPESTPNDAQGTSSAPMLDLVECQSNEMGGLLTPVGTFVEEIRALKADPDHQIVVGAIVAPAAPYTVAWIPAGSGQDAAAGELLPQVEHSCGPAGPGTNPTTTDLSTDGSFGDPGVRVRQFVEAFGANGVVASVCAATYTAIVQPLATLIATNVPIGAITGTAGDSGVGVDGDSGVSGTGGAAGGGGGIVNGPGAASGHGAGGLRAGGCNVLGTSAPAGSGLAALLIALAIARRRATREKT